MYLKSLLLITAAFIQKIGGHEQERNDFQDTRSLELYGGDSQRRSFLSHLPVDKTTYFIGKLVPMKPPASGWRPGPSSGKGWRPGPPPVKEYVYMPMPMKNQSKVATTKKPHYMGQLPMKNQTKIRPTNNPQNNPQMNNWTPMEPQKSQGLGWLRPPQSSFVQHSNNAASWSTASGNGWNMREPLDPDFPPRNKWLSMGQSNSHMSPSNGWSSMGELNSHMPPSNGWPSMGELNSHMPPSNSWPSMSESNSQMLRPTMWSSSWQAGPQTSSNHLWSTIQPMNSPAPTSASWPSMGMELSPMPPINGWLSTEQAKSQGLPSQIWSTIVKTNSPINENDWLTPEQTDFQMPSIGEWPPSMEKSQFSSSSHTIPSNDNFNSFAEGAVNGFV